MYPTIRGCLQDLLAANDKDSQMQVTENNVTKSATIDDLKEFNRNALFELADMLGMSDLYLEDDKEKSHSAKVIANKNGINSKDKNGEFGINADGSVY